MFDNLANIAIERHGKITAAELLAEDEARHRSVIESRVSAENEEALASLQADIDLIDIPEVINEANNVINLNPALRGKLGLSVERINWRPKAAHTTAVKAPLNAPETLPELRAMSGYAIFLSPGRNVWSMPNPFVHNYLWQEPLYNGALRSKTGHIFYVLGFAHGNRDGLLAPRWTLEADQLITGKRRRSEDPTVWNYLGDQVVDRRSRAEYWQNDRGYIPDFIKPPEFTTPTRRELQAVNDLFSLPVQAGRLFKREVGGGHYGINSQAFLPSATSKAEYQSEVAKRLETFILRNPFVKIEGL